MIVSPSHESTGPGGLVVAFCASRHAARVAAGPPAPYSLISLSAILTKLKPDPANLPTNLPLLMRAVASMCASASCTVQPAHCDGACHCASESPDRSSAREPRSVLITGQGLAAMTPFRWVMTVGSRAGTTA